MTLTYSAMLELGTELPSFKLFNTITDQEFDSNSLSSEKGKVIMFICNHCPFVIHYHEQLVKLYQDYADKLEFVAISSNDVLEYPQDAPEKMTELFAKLGLDFPYLYDESQEIAKKYHAVCTPEFYLFSADNKLIYRGRFDDSSPNNGKIATGSEFRAALDDFLSNKPISEQQLPSMGCNIKWK